MSTERTEYLFRKRVCFVKVAGQTTGSRWQDRPQVQASTLQPLTACGKGSVITCCHLSVSSSVNWGCWEDEIIHVKGLESCLALAIIILKLIKKTDYRLICCFLPVTSFPSPWLGLQRSQNYCLASVDRARLTSYLKKWSSCKTKTVLHTDYSPMWRHTWNIDTKAWTQGWVKWKIYIITASVSLLHTTGILWTPLCSKYFPFWSAVP